jgi:predicted nucleotide-binding protein
MQALDPLGPVLGLLFEDASSDYVLTVLSKAGIPTGFHLTEGEAYTHKTRKRAYRAQLDGALAAYDPSTKHRIAENIAKHMALSDSGNVARIGETLADVGWKFDGTNILSVGDRVKGQTDTAINFNLTNEQWDLLGTLVQVYNRGCKSEFLFVQTMSGSSLIYSGHPSVEVSASETDFEGLARENLVHLGRNSSGELRGKPTARGIRATADRGTSTVAIVESKVVHQNTLPNIRQWQERGKIFIGHGHSKEWMVLKDFLKDRLLLEWDEFNREPTAGKGTLDRLRELLEQAAFAFIVMTAEDAHQDGSQHARENVIHEAGLFQGRLGFEKAIILLEDGCAEFSNIGGLTTLRFPRGKISAAFEEIRRVLERENVLKT